MNFSQVPEVTKAYTRRDLTTAPDLDGGFWRWKGFDHLVSETVLEQIIREINELGYDFATIDDLRESRVRYIEAIPVLLRWLPVVTDSTDKDAVIRTLTQPWAKKLALDPLIEEFRNLPFDGELARERWVVGNALDVLWDDSRFDALAELLLDSRFGRARQMIAWGMSKSKRAEATEVLLRVADDPDLTGHVVRSLAKLADPQARPTLQAAEAHKEAWIRKYARKGISNLDRKEGAVSRS